MLCNVEWFSQWIRLGAKRVGRECRGNDLQLELTLHQTWKLEPVTVEIEDELSTIDAPLLHFSEANDDTRVTVQLALYLLCPMELSFKSLFIRQENKPYTTSSDSLWLQLWRTKCNFPLPWGFNIKCTEPLQKDRIFWDVQKVLQSGLKLWK